MAIDDRSEHEMTIGELKAHVDERFSHVDERFKDIEGHFAALEKRIADEGVQTRRHFDVIAESLRSEISLRFEGTQSTIDNHERRIQALEKRRRAT